jgi:hypothetical protein
LTREIECSCCQQTTVGGCYHEKVVSPLSGLAVRAGRAQTGHGILEVSVRQVVGRIALAVVLLGVFLTIGAEEARAQGMITGYGGKVGLNLATLSADPEDEVCPDSCDMKMGLAAGAFFGIGITDTISIQPEVLFSMKGAKDELFDEEGKININFVDVPILLRADIPTMGNIRPFVTAGPALGFVTSAKFEFDGEEEDFKDEIESVNFSAVIGGGVQIGQATVEARYDFGLRNLEKENPDELDVKTRTFMVLVGFGIPR